MRRPLMAGLVAALVLPAVAAPAAAQSRDVLVSAAASLTDVLTTIAGDFERDTGVHVTANFGSSSGLARQIVNGAPVDVFLSADEAQMDVVEKAGFVEPGTRVNLLDNQLVVVMPQGSRPLASPRDLATASIRRIALADPAAVPAGVYARRYLESIGLWSTIEAKVVPTLDVRAALAAVDSGNVDAAFVYKTDAPIAKRSAVVFSVPIADGPRIVYAAALIKGARHGGAARRLLTYLRGDAARRVFERYGFVVAIDGQ